MNNRKIFILIPDGVGLKNFAYGDFPEIGRELGFDLIYWNQTSKDLSKKGLIEIKLKSKPRAITDLFKRAKIESELNYFTKKFNDQVYQTYKFPSVSSALKSRLKDIIVAGLIRSNSGEKGLRNLQKKMENAERKSNYYRECREVLQREKPQLLFCSNQRPLTAIAPVVAAQDLGIPTACFIFSWDNLPKATKVIDTDFYLVWSEYMKEELIKYYPYISAEQVVVTGTPQFEVHFNKKYRVDREEFFKSLNLDKETEYLCFSGDDLTTSPGDHFYLSDVAEAVEKLNSDGGNIGIIFRRSPVDFSDRYDRVLKKFGHIITEVKPKWNKKGENWNEVLPEEEDLKLQTNIISHTFMVINLGSSMIFDYASYKKPCAFINYDPDGVEMGKDVGVIYNYVHFRSMPDSKAVLWINNKDEIAGVIEKSLNKDISSNLEKAGEWYQKINVHPPEKVSERFWKFISEIPSGKY